MTDQAGPSPTDDILGKLDALMKRHREGAEPEIPVLTELVDPPKVDLAAIPLLTDEVNARPPVLRAEHVTAPPVEPKVELSVFPSESSSSEEILLAPPPSVSEPTDEDMNFPDLPLVLDLLPETDEETEPAIADALLPEPEVPMALEWPAEPAATAQTSRAGDTTLPPVLEIEIPPDARYIPLRGGPAADPAQPPLARESVAIQALSEETIQHIADIIKDDVARVLDNQLQQALAQQLQSSLHVALDRALSSMLDQFIGTIEEVVRVSIADELQKQLAPFKRPAPPKS